MFSSNDVTAPHPEDYQVFARSQYIGKVFEERP